MINGKNDLLEALTDAFLMEKGTMVFYSEAAEKAVSPEAKKVFGDLSDWEEGHMDFILFLYQGVNGDRDVTTFEDFKHQARSEMTESGLTIKDLGERMERQTFTDEKDAIALALEIEGKAYNLYRKLSETAHDKNAQVVFKEMMHQEVKHIDCLKQLRINLFDVNKIKPGGKKE